MNLTNLVRKSLLPLSTLALVLGVSRPALAIEVMCQGPFGTCSVSNDGFDEVDCTCEGSGFGSTGGNEYAGLTEEELMAACLDFLADCEEFGEEGFETETGWEETTDTGEPDTSTTDTGWETDTNETGEPDTGMETGDGDGDGDEFGEESATLSTGDGDGDGEEAGDGDGDTGDSGDGDGVGDGDGDGDAGEAGDGDGDGDAGEAGDGDGDSAGESPNEAGDEGETDTGSTTGGASEDGDEGCACDVSNHASGLGMMALSILGLVGLRRRERDDEK